MPSKPKKNRPLENPFLFIQEDPSNASSSQKDPHADRTKQSHVQRRSFEIRRKQKRTKDSRQSAEESEKDNSASQTPSMISDPGPIPQDDLPTLLRRYPGLAFPFNRSQNHEFDSMALLISSTIDPELEQNDENTQRWVQSAISYTNQGTATPLHFSQRLMGAEVPFKESFTDIPMSFGSFAKPLIHYFLSTATYVAKYKATATNGELRQGDEVRADLQLCMSDQSQMYALLTYSAAAMLSFEGRLAIPGVNTEQHSHFRGFPLLFKIKTVEALRQRLANNKVDRQTITVARRLTAASIISENLEWMTRHHQALKSMVDEIGGILALNEYDMGLTIHLDLTYATRTGEKPIFAPIWDPGPFEGLHPSTPLLLPPYLSDNGLRMASIANDQTYTQHPDMADIIRGLLQARVVCQWLDLQDEELPQYIQWLTYRRLALCNHLLRIRSEIQRDSIGNVASAREWLLFQGLIYFVLLSFCVTIGARPIRFYKPIFPPRLSWLDEFTDELDADVQLWVIVMAGIGFLNAELSFAKFQENLMNNIDGVGGISEMGKRACNKLSIKSIAELEFMLRGFLFREDLLQIGKFRDFAQVFLNLRSETEVGGFLSQDFIPRKAIQV